MIRHNDDSGDSSESDDSVGLFKTELHDLRETIVALKYLRSLVSPVFRSVVSKV